MSKKFEEYKEKSSGVELREEISIKMRHALNNLIESANTLRYHLSVDIRGEDVASISPEKVQEINANVDKYNDALFKMQGFYDAMMIEDGIKFNFNLAKVAHLVLPNVEEFEQNILKSTSELRKAGVFADDPFAMKVSASNLIDTKIKKPSNRTIEFICGNYVCAREWIGNANSIQEMKENLETLRKLCLDDPSQLRKRVDDVDLILEELYEIEKEIEMLEFSMSKEQEVEQPKKAGDSLAIITEGKGKVAGKGGPNKSVSSEKE